MHKILSQIRSDPDLLKLEELGFQSGDRKGKTMDVKEYVIYESLQKQFEELEIAYEMGTLKELKRRIADLCNVAGVSSSNSSKMT